MRANLELTHGALFSQRALTALVESGMARDDAYRVVQESAQRAWDTGTPFRELLAEPSAPELDLDVGLRLRRLPRARARGRSARLGRRSATEQPQRRSASTRGVPSARREGDVAADDRLGPVVAAAARASAGSSRSATRISNWAKAAPRQRRVPPPNGIQE